MENWDNDMGRLHLIRTNRTSDNIEGGLKDLVFSDVMF